MRVLMDGDGCPVVRIAAEECKKHHIECLVFCDTAHEMRREDITLLTFDKGADSVDYALAGRVRPGDIVVTQDYGVPLCVWRGGRWCSIRTDGNTPNGTLMPCCWSDTKPENSGSPADAQKVLPSENGSRTSFSGRDWFGYWKQSQGKAEGGS